MTGLGLGPIAIREFLRQIVFADPSVSAVITDPEENNLRSLRALRSRIGFASPLHSLTKSPILNECNRLFSPAIN
jgi:hypothetical protein